MSLHDDWLRAQTALATPFFDAIRPSLMALGGHAWPGIDQLNALVATHTHVRFVPADAATKSAMQYETHIATTSEIPTRQNWHDLFNALQWLNFPLMKTAISRQHAALLARGGELEAKARSVPRDVLTMFDESGIIVVSKDETLLQLIRDFQWQTLFVDHRHEVETNMRFTLVGHGLMEKSLAPFIGITAKAMLLNIDIDDDLDQHATRWLNDETNLQSARNLSPLPLLGIPGWDARNGDAAFYHNTQYFRAGYTRDR